MADATGTEATRVLLHRGGGAVAVKVGFIGTGGIANAHFKALAQIEDAEVVACMDVDEERAAKAAARFPGASSYGDMMKMLDDQKLDAAYICVPPHAHGEIEMALIERGTPFLTEKPISNDRETPAKILEAVRAKDLLTSVGYMLRYCANADRLKQHLAEDPPAIARGAWIGGMPGVPWWRQKALSGGQIMEQTTHIFDLARYLFGDVVSVYCSGRKGLITDVENYDVEDASICTLTFESGLVCEISSSCAVGVGEVSLEVFTPSARLKLMSGKLALTIQKRGEKQEIAGTEDRFIEENQVWIEAVQSGDGSKIKSPYEDAYKTQMVTCAANESIATGKPVKP